VYLLFNFKFGATVLFHSVGARYKCVVNTFEVFSHVCLQDLKQLIFSLYKGLIGSLQQKSHSMQHGPLGHGRAKSGFVSCSA
jgi:hypothetical protein